MCQKEDDGRVGGSERRLKKTERKHFSKSKKIRNVIPKKKGREIEKWKNIKNCKNIKSIKFLKR